MRETMTVDAHHPVMSSYALMQRQPTELPVKTLVALSCCNAEKTIGSCVLQLKQCADEILVIDTGSMDKTVDIARSAGATVVQHRNASGYETVVQTCFSYAKQGGFDVLTIVDDYASCDLVDVVSVMKPVISDEADVSMSRMKSSKNKQESLFHRLNTWMFSHQKKADRGGDVSQYHGFEGGLRVFSKQAMQSFQLDGSNALISLDSFMDDLSWQHLRFTEVLMGLDETGDTQEKSSKDPWVNRVRIKVKQWELHHSLVLFGLPGLLFFCVGLLVGVEEYISYASVHFLRVNHVVLSLFCLGMGMLLAITGMIMHAVINASQRR